MAFASGPQQPEDRTMGGNAGCFESCGNKQKSKLITGLFLFLIFLCYYIIYYIIFACSRFSSRHKRKVNVLSARVALKGFLLVDYYHHWNVASCLQYICRERLELNMDTFVKDRAVLGAKIGCWNFSLARTELGAAEIWCVLNACCKHLQKWDILNKVQGKLPFTQL